MTIRWEIELELELETPLHTAADSPGGVVDAALLRDGLHRPIVPGTSLAGALRAVALEAVGEEDTAKVFGRGERPRDEDRDAGGTPDEDDRRGWASHVWVHDLVGSPTARTEVRTGVTIDRETGAAKPGLLYDREVLVPGTRLTGRLVLDPATDEAVKTLADVLLVVRRLGLDLGGGRSRGEGRCRLRQVKARRCDLGTATGVAGLLSDQTWDEDGIGALRESVAKRKAKQAARDLDRVEVASLVAPPMFLHILWGAEQPVFSSSSVNPSDEFDLVPETIRTATGERLVLRGSSIKGVLRSHAERILRTVLGDAADHAAAMRPIEWLFGTGKGSEDGIAAPGRGAVRVSDCYGEDVLPPAAEWSTGERTPRGYAHGKMRLYPSTHVAIDRWTGGGSDGALFTVLEPVGARWEPMRLEIDHGFLEATDVPEKVAALALLRLVLQDLAAGRLAFGFGTRRGRGAVKIRGFDDLAPWKITGELRNRPLADLDLMAADVTASWATWLEAIETAQTQEVPA